MQSSRDYATRKTYALAIEKAHGLVALDLPLMTLSQAEKARDTLAQYNKATLVVNVESL